MSSPADALTARYTLAYPYERSLGPLLTQAYAGLAERRILAARGRDGRVWMPPSEADPAGHAAVELVPVGPGGVVETAVWVATPAPEHPVAEPFAWALIRLDGADTAFLHVVPGPEGTARPGVRVVAAWREERTGSPRDLVGFVPEGADGA